MVPSLDFQSFILRARVLKLYRQALKIARRAPVHVRGELKQTVRQEMEKNRDCNDKQKIRYLISEGLERVKGLDEMLDMQAQYVILSPKLFNFGWSVKRGEMMAAVKLQKWRNLASRVDLMARSDAISIRRFLHEGPDTVEELLDRHLAKKEKPIIDADEAEFLNRQRLTSTRREALSLYRDILRATRFFMWTDSRGVLWRDLLRENARKEFEAARFESDPEVITRLLIGGSDAVSSALDKLAEKQKEMIEKKSRGDNRELTDHRT